MKYAKLAPLALSLLVLPAFADTFDIQVLPQDDVVNYRYWWYGGSDRGSIADANPNVVSHSWEPGNGASFSTSLLFKLDGLAALTSADISAVSFNFHVIDLSTQGRDDIGTISGSLGSVLFSRGAGWQSYDATALVRQAMDQGATSLALSIDFTGYSGFTFGSAEGGDPAYLRITTAVPEPAPSAMLLAGLAVAVGLARRRFAA